MKWRRMPLGPIQTNAYILSHDDGTCLIIDPGSESGKLDAYIKENGLKPLAVLLTHAHFDHIGAVDNVRKEWNIPVYVHKNEAEWLTDPSLNGSALLTGQTITAEKADHLIEEEGDLKIGSFTLRMLFTPGHSPGSVSYYAEEENLIVSGDVLFKGGVGRTDLPGGNQKVLMDSIHQKLLTLPEETLVLSGHGPETDIATEQEQNPFINGFTL
ncbi:MULTISPECIES: MBL fold metallo-hydrolase [Bacillus]|uniref:MBL fold metallo-hydrolase n=1 Tax=Bacillus TaxID=1386 RepID=UPI00046F08F1|nr:MULTISPECIES: MBL fold metallo-hydrolase [Bacillus]MBC8624929.1 MBL fold metallo-hydrolase [Robertmurraya crescens]MCW4367593.1 MBL fold metallo-hydrolase [Bacillus paralicheniformis]MCY1629327.1 MBL fold metallo-hydrolase [Bacillus paralicheniformis]MDE1360493.1 MBL fold metallo-hydrolase [Bacillus paralicheniformis]MEC2098765.1 MBL fold metallo-hydrolase [Bacillus paralicheniformis]